MVQRCSCQRINDVGVKLSATAGLDSAAMADLGKDLAMQVAASNRLLPRILRVKRIKKLYKRYNVPGNSTRKNGVLRGQSPGCHEFIPVQALKTIFFLQIIGHEDAFYLKVNQKRHRIYYR